MMNYFLPDEQATQCRAKQMAEHLQPPLVITLQGDLGAGKTTFVRALLQTLGITTTIKSPTFTLVESYECQDWQIHHFDLYRLEYAEELEDMGFRDYFHPNALCLIEWPEKVPAHYIPTDVAVQLGYQGQGRMLRLSAHSDSGQALLNAMPKD